MVNQKRALIATVLTLIALFGSMPSSPAQLLGTGVGVWLVFYTVASAAGEFKKGRSDPAE